MGASKRSPFCYALSIALGFLSACSSQATRPEFTPPPEAPDHQALIHAIPAELFKGDFSTADQATGEPLEIVFLKNEPADLVPMRVVVYTKTNGKLTRQFVAPTPFAPGDCRREECRARVAEMPGGFQISRESFGADRLRADYRFRREGQDFTLIGKGFRAKRPGTAKTCSVFYDFGKARVLRREGGPTQAEKMAEAGHPRLLRDRLRFESMAPADLCGKSRSF